MDVLERARAILVNPQQTWAAIDRESTPLRNLVVPYLATLALIPAVSSFFGWSVLGVMTPAGLVRLPALSGLLLMACQYGLTLGMILAWGWLVAQVAAAFGGTPHLESGLKLSVYASTPAFLAAAFGAMPGLAILSLVGALYALYLMYVGLPILMKNPPQRTSTYLALCAILGLLGSLLISMLSMFFVPTPLQTDTNPQDASAVAPPPRTPDSPKPDSAVVIQTPDGQKKVVAESMQDMLKRLEALAAEQEKAKKGP